MRSSSARNLKMDPSGKIRYFNNDQRIIIDYKKPGRRGSSKSSKNKKEAF
jgi:hypothetical protein